MFALFSLTHCKNYGTVGGRKRGSNVVGQGKRENKRKIKTIQHDYFRHTKARTVFGGRYNPCLRKPPRVINTKTKTKNNHHPGWFRKPDAVMLNYSSMEPKRNRHMRALNTGLL